MTSSKLKQFVVSVGLAVFLVGGNSPALAQAPVLDTETLQAETDGGVLEAMSAANAYVGEITEDMFIGIGLPEDDQSPVRAYVCDGSATGSVWMTGSLDGDAIKLEHGALRITGTVRGDLIEGALESDGTPEHVFTAEAAEGEAGLYWAADRLDGKPNWAGWVVLADGRQQGLVCCCGMVRPCFIGCCGSQF